MGGLSQPSQARVTAIVEVTDIDHEQLRRLISTLMAARSARDEAAPPLSVDIAHDPIHRTVKVILAGSPLDVSTLLTLVDACTEA